MIARPAPDPTAGAAAGLLGAATGAALLAAAGGFAPGGPPVTAAAPGLAFAAQLLSGAVLGAVYVGLFRPDALGVAEGLLSAVALAVGWWVVLPVTLLPVALGQGPKWEASAVSAALPVLFAYVCQGAVTGLSWPLLSRAAPMTAPPAPVRPQAERSPRPRHRVVVLGGGFAGVSAARELERLTGRDGDVAITLVSETNHLLFTPMLSEVTAGGVEAQHIGPPLRSFFAGVDVVRGAATAVDLASGVVRLAPEAAGAGPRELPVDHLVLALGAVPHFFGSQRLEEHAFTFKSLGDAVRLRNHVIDALERADAESDAATRRALLTFVVAGGGFAGVELIGGLNDFVRGALWYYPNVPPEEVSLVLVHAGDRVLPELSAGLGAYAREKLAARGVAFRLGVRLADAGPDAVTLSSGETIPTRTLVWTAGNAPHPLLRALGLPVDRRGAVETDATLAVLPGPSDPAAPPGGGRVRVWAVGDCAAIPDLAAGNGKTCPPTAQHALREAKTLAHNLHATLRGAPPRPFRFRAVGALAVLGHQTACAELYGRRFSGLLAWWLWRTIYLGKLPTLEKRVRVALDWAVDLFFPRDIVRVQVPERAPDPVPVHPPLPESVACKPAGRLPLHGRGPRP
jgi:NADH dehydrogenase